MNKFKDIYVLPHSHFDYGYTHPQRMLMELQKDYLSEAIDLCIMTREMPEAARFKWTIEANHILVEWMKQADEESMAKLKQCISEGLIAITALPYHTTPLADLGEQVDLFDALADLEETFSYKIKTAINHDINGQPWTMQQMLKQVGVDFYLTGINIHFGGLPFERPQPFLWEGSDGSRLTTFLGEHYSLFSQFSHTEQLPRLFAKGASSSDIHQAMRVELEAYETALRNRQWSKPFYVLTATNPPLYDNNSPDKYLTKAVAAFNETSQDQQIHIITIDELRELVMSHWTEDELAVHRGDWTDFWNYGAGSTPAETRIHKQTQRMLRATDWLNSLRKPNPRTLRNLKEARQLNRFYGEHTWGASESITDPGSDMSKSQRVHKDHLAWDASALAAYALGTAVETVNDRPGDFALEADNVVATLYNPTAFDFEGYVDLPFLAGEAGDSSLEALRIKDFLAYHGVERRPAIKVSIPAFSRRVFKLDDLFAKKQSLNDMAHSENPFIQLDVEAGRLTSEFFELRYDKESGKIEELIMCKSGHRIDGAAYGFASVIREQLAAGQVNGRQTFFPRDVMLGNLSQSVWNHDWQADRAIANKLENVELRQEEGRAIFTRHWVNQIGAEDLSIDLIFYVDKEAIDIDVRMTVNSPVTPLSYYLSFPTDLDVDWAGTYDSAGTPVRLDHDQLGAVSKDWVTLDNYYAAHDERRAYILASPDARLLQPSGFGFGRESKILNREKNPLILAWLANNYWDTNFAASFAGRLNFHFAFKPCETFDPMEALALAAHAEQVVLVGLAEGDTVGDDSWYEWKSDQVALQLLRPHEDGLLLAVRNLDNDGPASFEFNVRHQSIAEAWLSNPIGRQMEKLETAADGLTMDCAAGSLVFLKLRFKNK